MFVLIYYCLFLLGLLTSLLYLRFLSLRQLCVDFSDVLACLFQLFPQIRNLFILIGIPIFIILQPLINSHQFTLILPQKLLIFIDFSFLADQLQFYFLLDFDKAANLSVHFLDSSPQLLIFGLKVDILTGKRQFYLISIEGSALSDPEFIQGATGSDEVFGIVWRMIERLQLFDNRMMQVAFLNKGHTGVVFSRSPRPSSPFLLFPSILSLNLLYSPCLKNWHSGWLSLLTLSPTLFPAQLHGLQQK